jgi:hypothetical protein
MNLKNWDGKWAESTALISALNAETNHKKERATGDSWPPFQNALARKGEPSLPYRKPACNYSPSPLDAGGRFPACFFAPSSRRLNRCICNQSAIETMPSTKTSSPAAIRSGGQKVKPSPFI